NRQAIRLAKEVAKEHPEEEALVAGNISNTNLFDPEDENSKEQIRSMLTMQGGTDALKGDLRIRKAIDVLVDNSKKA
ncbi:hypothetical protein R0K20_17560, partial [Staphylococcus sp. SIMBA_130]